MKKVLFLFILSVFALNAFAQSTQTQVIDLTKYGVRIEPDRRLIVVMAALEAAGLETPLTMKGAEFRQKIRADFSSVDKDLTGRMKIFVDRYVKRQAEKYAIEFAADEKNSFPAMLDKYRAGGMSDDEKKAFFDKHKRFFENLTSPFISMAYTLSPVPDLSEPARATDLPGELLEVLDFSPLVREFYRRSGLNTNLDQYVKDYYQTAAVELRPSTAQMVKELLDYMHTKPELLYVQQVKVETKTAKSKKIEKTENRERERRFFIVPELLTTKGTINFINVSDDYYAILPTETNLSQSEVRNAYLQFVLDPLVLQNSKEILTFRDGIKVLLEQRRRTNPDVSPDVFLAVLRSLVAAVDARQIEFEKTRLATSQARQKIDLMKTVEEKKAVSAELDAFKKSFADDTAALLSDAYERGAVLAFYFADSLKGSEESGFDIAGSIHDVILSIDPTKEADRLTQFADARKRSDERKRNARTQPKVIDNPVTVRLLEIDKVISAKDYSSAETSLQSLLKEYPTESARIYYQIGRVSSLSAENLAEADLTKRNVRLLEAKTAYTNVIRTATDQTDPALLSLSYVALGRIYEFYDQPEYAVKLYETAIRVGDVSGGAFKEAIEARERLVKK
jgi:hypothetical protein